MQLSYCINLSIQPSFELVSFLRYHKSGMRDRSILVIHLACGEAPPEMGAFQLALLLIQRDIHSKKLAILELRRELR